MRCEGWCGFCYENAKGRANHKGHGGFRPVCSIFSPEVTMALKRPSAGASGARVDLPTPSGGSWAGYEHLWDFLVSDVYEDGGKRALPTLMFFLHDGRLTGALNDRDVNRTAFVSGERPESILEALEMGLKKESLEWRPNKVFIAKKK